MKFHGKIGFWTGDFEVEPGVFKPKIVERPYTGDVFRNIRRFEAVSDQQNDDLKVNNQFSILSDLYLKENFNSIRYIIWNGVRWKVSSIDVAYPRITLEIGGVYNGEGPS